MKPNERPIELTPFTNPNGSIVWRVSGTVNGERRRKNYESKEIAVTVKQNWERERLNMAAVPIVTTRLTPERAKEAEALYHRLDALRFSLDLSACVEFAVNHYRPSKRISTVANAVALFLQAKRDKRLRVTSINGLTLRLDRLSAVAGDKLVNEIQPDVLKPLIFRPGNGPEAIDGHYRVYTNFFNWCVEQEYCASSPLDKIGKVILDDAAPKWLKLDECRKLVVSASTYKDGVCLPYIVLSLFAAIRPKELERLCALGKRTWDAIDLTDATVTIDAEIAKMRGRRVVSLEPNAVEMLQPFALARPAICPKKRDFDAVRVNAGFVLKHWPKDVMRHTAISHHLVKYNNEGLTAQWAGNSPDVIHKHYKGLVKAKDTAQFWQITGQENIVQLQAQRA